MSFTNRIQVSKVVLVGLEGFEINLLCISIKYSHAEKGFNKPVGLPGKTILERNGLTITTFELTPVGR